SAGAPGPGAQRPPVVHLAGLSLVDQADDSLCQPSAVVGLDTVGAENGIAPAFGQNLLLPVRPAARSAETAGRSLKAGGSARCACSALRALRSCAGCPLHARPALRSARALRSRNDRRSLDGSRPALRAGRTNAGGAALSPRRTE